MNNSKNNSKKTTTIQKSMVQLPPMAQIDLISRIFATRLAVAPKVDKAVFLQAIENSPVLTPAEQAQLMADIQGNKVAVRAFDITVKVPLDKATVKIFDPAKGLVKGITNIRNATLDKGIYFVPSRMRLRVGTASADTEAALLATSFGSVGGANYSNVENGFLRLWHDGQKLLNDFAVNHFNTDGNHHVATGIYELPESIVLPPNVELKCELEMRNADEIIAIPNAYIEFQLSGMATSTGA